VGVGQRGERGFWFDRAVGGLRPLPRYEHRVFDLGEGAGPP
jgi:hypothetical protein